MTLQLRPVGLQGWKDPLHFCEARITADCPGACCPVHGEVAPSHHTLIDIA